MFLLIFRKAAFLPFSLSTSSGELPWLVFLGGEEKMSLAFFGYCAPLCVLCECCTYSSLCPGETLCWDYARHRLARDCQDGASQQFGLFNLLLLLASLSSLLFPWGRVSKGKHIWSLGVGSERVIIFFVVWQSVRFNIWFALIFGLFLYVSGELVSCCSLWVSFLVFWLPSVNALPLFHFFCRLISNFS